MKLVTGCFLLAVGVLLIVLCIVLRTQFNAAVAQGNPNFDDYPLVKPLIPQPSADVGVAAAEQAAETALLRIYAVGGVGLFFVLTGSLVLVIPSRKSTHT